MWQAALALFSPDLDCQAPCATEPRGQVDRGFSLNVLVHAVSLTEVSGGSGAGPCLGLAVKDSKDGGGVQLTEPGRWNAQQRRWEYRDSLAFKVNVEDQISLVVYCSGSSTASTARASTGGTSTGGAGGPAAELRLGVSQAVARMRMQDRMDEGLIYSSSTITFDLVSSSGDLAGRVWLQFQTKEPWAFYHGDEDEPSAPQMFLPEAANSSDMAWRRGGQAAVGVAA